MTLSEFFYRACIRAQHRRDPRAFYKVLDWLRWAKKLPRKGEHKCQSTK
jgi:hypothetical protein